ncbi:MAG: hypothetical protein NXI30_23770 [bacterium]|nr:hypothetical protein [bacterium]
MSHRERGPGVPHPIIHRPENESDSASEAEPNDLAATPSDANLAGFALLADPSTIAGGGDAPGTDSHEEVERLRAALHLRSQEIEALQSKWAGPAEEAPEASRAPETKPDGPARAALLDAASARRLAADARKRERESRIALEEAQKALGTDVPPVSPTEPAAGWQQRALVARGGPTEARTQPAPEVAAPSEAREQTPAEPSAPPTLDPEETLRALGRELRLVRAENRERESTLALAREKTRRQHEEIERLRTALAEGDRADGSGPSANETTASAALAPAGEDTTVRALDGDDSRALAARVTALEAELAERDAETARLDAALAQARALDTQRRERIDALQDRLEAQDRALDAARREYELERQRHTRSRGLITRLRTTLSAAVPDESFAEDDDPIALDATAVSDSRSMGTRDLAPEPTNAPPALRSDDEPTSDIDTAVIDRADLSARDTAVIDRAGVIARDTEQRRADVRLFDDWLDDQVRRHFGPMGIDQLSDLMIAPLARRGAEADGGATILLLGRNGWLRAAGLAEALVVGSAEPITIHVADPVGSPDDLAIDSDSPLRDLLVPTPAPADPEALASLLDALRPALVVSHSHLSNEASPDAWLAVLEDAVARQTALLFVESTGVGDVPAPEEVRAVGDRIWSLLPERYALRPGDDVPLPTWSAAFEQASKDLANGLFEALRSRFRPELSARFGFLVAPFLHAGLAANFDVAAERDRRFLEQVADLDERRIEAGEAPALHAIALVDPLAEA